MKKVTGIGGIFFKCESPDETKAWYSENLGLETDAWGTNFEWRQAGDPGKKGFTQWSPASENSRHFHPSQKDYMINYRVADLVALEAELRKAGVEILDEMETFPYGKFLHIMDPNGVKIELWEPNDEAYDEIVEGRTC
ncbi:MAG: VOC family protein [Cryomorphaceae bacterium]|nr:VOC family protein [Flavobacteriales bacterium]